MKEKGQRAERQARKDEQRRTSKEEQETGKRRNR
jgi:hypothetical protein